MKSGVVAALCVPCVIAGAFLWWTSRAEPAPPGVLFVVHGEHFQKEDLARRLGREPRFVSLGEAEVAVRAAIDEMLLEREADRRMSIGERVSTDRILERMVTEQGRNATPTESDIETYYEAHRDEFVRPRSTSFDLVSVSKGGREEEARREIEAIRVRAEMNLELSPLEPVALRRPDGARWIEVPSLPCDGAGSEESTSLPDSVRRAACELPVGLVSQPIESEVAWHVVRVTATHAALHTSLERAESGIRRLLSEQQQNARWTSALQQLRDDGRVAVSKSELMGLVDNQADTREGTIAEPGGPPTPPGSGGQRS